MSGSNAENERRVDWMMTYVGIPIPYLNGDFSCGLSGATSNHRPNTGRWLRFVWAVTTSIDCVSDFLTGGSLGTPTGFEVGSDFSMGDAAMRQW